MISWRSSDALRGHNSAQKSMNYSEQELAARPRLSHRAAQARLQNPVCGLHSAVLKPQRVIYAPCFKLRNETHTLAPHGLNCRAETPWNAAQIRAVIYRRLFPVIARCGWAEASRTLQGCKGTVSSLPSLRSNDGLHALRLEQVDSTCTMSSYSRKKQSREKSHAVEKSPQRELAGLRHSGASSLN